MPCTATSLVALAAAGKFPGLSERDLKLATLYALCVLPGPSATAQTLISGAMAAGYDGLSDRELEECILAVVCSNVNSQILASGLAQLSGGTVVVSSAAALATNPILLTYFSLNNQQATIGYGTVVDGVSFTITSANPTDNNMVAWAILKP